MPVLRGLKRRPVSGNRLAPYDALPTGTDQQSVDGVKLRHLTPISTLECLCHRPIERFNRLAQIIHQIHSLSVISAKWLNGSIRQGELDFGSSVVTYLQGMTPSHHFLAKPNHYRRIERDASASSCQCFLYCTTACCHA